MACDKVRITPAEEMLRKQAAAPTMKRLAADKVKAPALAPYLETIERMLFGHHFNVAALWRAHGIGDNNESRKFASQVGLFPSAYISECRLSVAARLLAHTRLGAGRIGELVGYSADTTFWRAFKRWSGRAPDQYRVNPGRDPDPWEAPVDLTRISDGLEGRLSPPQRRTLCRQLGDLHDALADSFEPPGLDELLNLADRSKTVDDEIRYLERAGRHSEAAGRRAELSGRRAVAIHCRGTFRTLTGDIDRGYEDLAQAHALYSAAGDLAPHIARRRQCFDIQVPSSTEASLLSALCPDCRGAMVSDTGLTLRQHLRNALDPVPLDLSWFRRCCDECYRIVWKSFIFARHGLLRSAWQAWWLVAHADLRDSSAPPSVGRVIAALTEVDSLSWPSQADRLERCDLALADARVLARPDLLLVARFWRGNVRRALAFFPEARQDLQLPERKVDPWLQALRARFLGLVELNLFNLEEADALTRTAAELYRHLDQHMAALLLDQLGIICFRNGQTQRAIDLFRQTPRLLDRRRSPGPTPADVPINLAAALALIGDWDAATRELAACQYDRNTYPGIAAAEDLTRGCIALGLREPLKAIENFLAAQRRYESLGEQVETAIAATYSVEAYYTLGEFSRALELAASAMRLFEAANCPVGTLQAATALKVLVAEQAAVAEVADGARRLARLHGGWLPELSSAH